jgi:hypothetical protein
MTAGGSLFSQSLVVNGVQPTKLEMLVTSTPGSVVERHVLGSLSSGDTRATFSTIVARESPNCCPPPLTGVEVRMQQGNRDATVYLGAEGLEGFQSSLAALVAKRDELYKKKDWGRTTVRFFIRLPAELGGRNGVSNVINAGWYRDGSESGVTLDCAHGGIFNFPNADLRDVEKLIGSARTALEPLTPPQDAPARSRRDR